MSDTTKETGLISRLLLFILVLFGIISIFSVLVFNPEYSGWSYTTSAIGNQSTFRTVITFIGDTYFLFFGRFGYLYPFILTFLHFIFVFQRTKNGFSWFAWLMFMISLAVTFFGIGTIYDATIGHNAQLFSIYDVGGFFAQLISYVTNSNVGLTLIIGVLVTLVGIGAVYTSLIRRILVDYVAYLRGKDLSALDLDEYNRNSMNSAIITEAMKQQRERLKRGEVDELSIYFLPGLETSSILATTQKELNHLKVLCAQYEAMGTRGKRQEQSYMILMRMYEHKLAELSDLNRSLSSQSLWFAFTNSAKRIFKRNTPQVVTAISLKQHQGSKVDDLLHGAPSSGNDLDSLVGSNSGVDHRLDIFDDSSAADQAPVVRSSTDEEKPTPRSSYTAQETSHHYAAGTTSAGATMTGAAVAGAAYAASQASAAASTTSSDTFVGTTSNDAFDLGNTSNDLFTTNCDSFVTANDQFTASNDSFVGTTTNDLFTANSAVDLDYANAAMATGTTNAHQALDDLYNPTSAPAATSYAAPSTAAPTAQGYTTSATSTTQATTTTLKAYEYQAAENIVDPSEAYAAARAEAATKAQMSAATEDYRNILQDDNQAQAAEEQAHAANLINNVFGSGGIFSSPSTAAQEPVVSETYEATATADSFATEDFAEVTPETATAVSNTNSVLDDLLAEATPTATTSSAQEHVDAFASIAAAVEPTAAYASTESASASLDMTNVVANEVANTVIDHTANETAQAANDPIADLFSANVNDASFATAPEPQLTNDASSVLDDLFGESADPATQVNQDLNSIVNQEQVAQEQVAKEQTPAIAQTNAQEHALASDNFATEQSSLSDTAFDFGDEEVEFTAVEQQAQQTSQAAVNHFEQQIAQQLDAIATTATKVDTLTQEYAQAQQTFANASASDNNVNADNSYPATTLSEDYSQGDEVYGIAHEFLDTLERTKQANYEQMMEERENIYVDPNLKDAPETTSKETLLTRVFADSTENQQGAKKRRVSYNQVLEYADSERSMFGGQQVAEAAQRRAEYAQALAEQQAELERKQAELARLRQAKEAELQRQAQLQQLAEQRKREEQARLAEEQRLRQEELARQAAQLAQQEAQRQAALRAQKEAEERAQREAAQRAAELQAQREAQIRQAQLQAHANMQAGLERERLRQQEEMALRASQAQAYAQAALIGVGMGAVRKGSKAQPKQMLNDLNSPLSPTGENLHQVFNSPELAAQTPVTNHQPQVEQEVMLGQQRDK
ncbi:hypothetical protein [Psittacicella hinzii]|uniref:Uncharacterized protein n=1 Tax=Psittacicella hinzii TaxID=2028575 RepID=A0A3A1YLR5_9GAMM|nr:hypothetical protein [Psittacicella hinzii]RIY38605.1 hypothetical protein CKF58_03830 [Psittacicella hinzii]